MQFQELENLIQISPCHSRTPSGFVMEMMSVKPAKGRTLFTVPTCSAEVLQQGQGNVGDFLRW